MSAVITMSLIVGWFQNWLQIAYGSFRGGEMI